LKRYKGKTDARYTNPVQTQNMQGNGFKMTQNGVPSGRMKAISFHENEKRFSE
jgi:hypothetical protein